MYILCTLLSVYMFMNVLPILFVLVHTQANCRSLFSFAVRFFLFVQVIYSCFLLFHVLRMKRSYLYVFTLASIGQYTGDDDDSVGSSMFLRAIYKRYEIAAFVFAPSA